MRRRFCFVHPALCRPIALFLAVLFLCLSLSSCSVTVERTETEPTGDLPAFNETDPGGKGDETPKRPRVALTFDDGPQHYNNEETKSLVDELVKYGYRATFFVVGNRVAGGDAVAYAVEKGMEIGIHGYTHDVYYDGCTEEEFFWEMDKTVSAIQRQAPGYEPTLMRPIGGHISADIQTICPYSIIMWSIDTTDYNYTYNKNDTDETAQAKVDVIVENALRGVTDGSIILMHDIYQSTYDAAVIILQRLNEMGYDVVTVSELFDGELEAGQIYYENE